jgi:CheY-like chemotaxis protein
MGTKGIYDNEADDLVVFYADDDRDDLDTFRDVVGELDYNLSVYTHDSADKLLDALNNPPPLPGVIFLDLNMPGKNGFEVLEEMKQDDDLKHLPVVVFSTSSDEKTIAQCKLLGANYYIPKASDYFVLKNSINHALQIDWASFKPDTDNFVYRDSIN